MYGCRRCDRPRRSGYSFDMAEEPVTQSGTEVAELVAADGRLRERLIGIAREKFRLDRETAEDLLQETAVILIGLNTQVRRPDGFAYQVFHTRCCHYVERQAGRRKLLAVAGLGPKRHPRDAATDMELAAALRQGLSRLSPTCQKLLRGHYWEGRTLDETARELSKAEAGISTLVSRCLARLRRIVSCVKS